MERPDEELEQLTDVESSPGTSESVGGSSVTQFPHLWSETEYGFDEIDGNIAELIESQFQQNEDRGGVVETDVQEWLNTAEDETQDAIEFVPEPGIGAGHIFEEKDIEKSAAILTDALKYQPFSAKAWIDADKAEQQVPNGSDFKPNFMKEIELRPVLTLMYAVRTYCAESDDNKSDNLYMQILMCATRNLTKQDSGCIGESKINFADADVRSLKQFRGGYFDPLRLKFTKLPKKKIPLVRAVEAYVSEEIAVAAATNNAVVFTRYTSIPEIIEKCNRKKGLGFTPDQTAKYGIILQKAVNQEIIARCLDYLTHVGFTLVAEDVDGEKPNLCSGFSQGSSSYGSQPEEPDSQSSQESGMGEFYRNNIPMIVINENGEQDPQNIPGEELRIEIMRGQIGQGDESPGGSQQSWQSYDSQSLPPPQYSIPEQEPEGFVEHIPVDVRDYEPEEMVDLSAWVEQNRGSQGSQGSSSSEDEGPRRQRPRLE